MQKVLTDVKKNVKWIFDLIKLRINIFDVQITICVNIFE